jgi:hypothetical protein
MNREIRNLAFRIGMPLRRLGPGFAYWTGSALNLSIVEQAREEQHTGLVAHEIGHFICAAPERRHVRNYGFGENARDEGCGAPRLLSARAARTEENLAALIGNVLVAHFYPGGLALSFEDTLFVQRVRRGWVIGGGERDILKMAMRRGLLAACEIPILRSPFGMVDFFVTNAEAMLSPIDRMIAAGFR